MDRYKILARNTAVRFTEFFVIEVLCSIALSIAFLMNMFPHTMAYCFMFSAAAVAVIAVVDVIMLRRFYGMVEFTRDYYIVAYAAYALFILFTVIMFVKASNEIFTYLLSAVKFMRYTGLRIKGRYSMMMFHMIMLIAIAVAPIGLQSREKKRKIEEEAKRWREENALTKETYVPCAAVEIVDEQYYEQKREKELSRESEDSITHATYVQAGDVDVINADYYKPRKSSRHRNDGAMTHDDYVQAGDVDVINADYYKSRKSSRHRKDGAMTHDDYVKAQEQRSGTKDNHGHRDSRKDGEESKK